MKKVAIVTPEALAPRSFLWDELSERFKVKINNLGDNPITQQEDGLCILGDGSEVVETVNVLGRRAFVSGVVDLPHLRLEITPDNQYPLVLIPKVNIPNLTLQILNDGSIRTSYHQNMQSGQRNPLEVGTSCRIAYEYAGSVVVMDVFLARVEGPTKYGFVDILINAKVEDFPPVNEGVVISPPMAQ